MTTPERQRDPGELVGELYSVRRKARRHLLGRMVNAREDERRRIAQEIHRSPLQVLEEVAAYLRGLGPRVEPQIAEELASLGEGVENALDRLRDLTYELSLVSVEREGLAGALRHQIQRMKDETGIHYRLEDRMWSEPSAPARVTLYRVAEEALTNVRRHAVANNVNVLLESDEGFRIRVEDDGVGFRPERCPPAPDRLGIPLMRQRVEAAGGWFELRSAPGQGTVVDFAVPVRAGELLAKPASV